ncbi:MAG: ATP-binding protein [Bdellovibrionales bacterium]|nr:ATP-binding protein [Bdellovibrionales bacterium]
MLDLLSDVFEFDVDLEQDVVQTGNLNLKLIELPEDEKENFHTMGLKFAFKLKNPDEIKKIVNKYNFFLYRKSDSHKQEAIRSIETKELAITDIDGRIWQFNVDADWEEWQ